jgi:hypothetical protein
MDGPIVISCGRSSWLGVIVRPLAVLICVASLPVQVLAAEVAKTNEMSAGQIIERHVAARGGREAWSRVQSLVWSGHMESGNTTVSGAPFLMELKRPDKTRFEMRSRSQTVVRAFDGRRGWSERDSPSGRTLADYTAAERTYAADTFGMVGPLMNCPANGVRASTEGLGSIDGRQAYRLLLILPSGASRHTWIDAETFLELRYDHTVVNAQNQPGIASVYYRNYRAYDGVQLPMIIETGEGQSHTVDRMVIERVLVNAPVDDRRFAKPLSVKGQRGSHGASGHGG